MVSFSTMHPSLPGTIRVLIAAEDPLARAALAMLLVEDPRCQVVGQVDLGRGVEDEWRAFEPDVLIWDMGWAPQIDQIQDQMDQLVVDDEMPLMVLLPDEELAPIVWRAGVRAMLARDVASDTLAAGAVAVSLGLVVLDHDLSESLLSAPPPSADSTQELTPRETEVLRLVAEGMSNRAIGHSLGISPHTVKFHLASLMGKLDAQSRTEAVVVATRLGYILL
jgi:DNA-binding NarL/FixJ family response regulator